MKLNFLPKTELPIVQDKAAFLNQTDAASYLLQACFLLTAGYSCLVWNLLALSFSCIGCGASYGMRAASFGLFGHGLNKRPAHLHIEAHTGHPLTQYMSSVK